MPVFWRETEVMLMGMGGEEGCISEELGRKKPESENIMWKISIFNKRIK